MFSKIRDIASRAADFGSLFRGGGRTGGAENRGPTRDFNFPGRRDSFDPGGVRKQTSNVTTKPTLLPGEGPTKNSVMQRLFDRFSERFPRLGEMLKPGIERFLKMASAYTSKPTLAPPPGGMQDG